MMAELKIHSTQRISRRTMAKGLAAAVLSMSGIGCASFGSSGSATPTPTSPPLGTILFTYRGHSGRVAAVTWSPDGKRIASASTDRTVQVWGAADGSNVYTYRGHDSDVPEVERTLGLGLETVAWSPDGKRIASGDCCISVQVWDAGDGSLVSKYTGGNGSFDVAWSPDGKRIASVGSTVQVWDAVDGGNVYTYSGHSDVVFAAA
jgi:WD40 repeat protein